MSAAEFERWMYFYRDQPFDDFHRFHRPAALITQSFRGGDINEFLDYLQPPFIPEDMSEADLNTLKAFGIRPGAR